MKIADIIESIDQKEADEVLKRHMGKGKSGNKAMAEIGIGQKELDKLSNMNYKTTGQKFGDAINSVESAFKNAALEMKRDGDFIKSDNNINKEKGLRKSEENYLEQKFSLNEKKDDGKSNFEKKLDDMTKDHNIPKEKK